LRGTGLFGQRRVSYAEITMKPGSLLLAILPALLPAVCAQTADDISVSGTLEKAVPLDGARRVVRCYCPQRATQAAKTADTVVLDIAATYASVGCHGSRKKTERIEDAQMRFVATRDGDALVLESRERRSMHRAFRLTRLRIALPDGLELPMETIPLNALEGRRVDGKR
jgi:hypothetical protein